MTRGGGAPRALRSAHAPGPASPPHAAHGPRQARRAGALVAAGAVGDAGRCLRHRHARRQPAAGAGRRRRRVPVPRAGQVPQRDVGDQGCARTTRAHARTHTRHTHAHTAHAHARALATRQAATSSSSSLPARVCSPCTRRLAAASSTGCSSSPTPPRWAGSGVWRQEGACVWGVARKGRAEKVALLTRGFGRGV